MKSKSTVLGIVLGLLVVFTAPAMAANTGFFTNYTYPISGGSSEVGEITYVEVWVNITDSHGIYEDSGEDYALDTVSVNVTFDSNIGDITACNMIPGHPWDGSWMKSHHGDTWYVTAVYDTWGHGGPPFGLGPGVYPIANYTIRGKSPGVMDLHFSLEYPRKSNMFDAVGEEYPNQTWEDSTFTCTGPAETFEKGLILGWNLVSLPLTPLNSSTSAVLGNDTIVYDAVYRYNATLKQFEDVTTGTIYPGSGYFVNVTTAGTWSYEGMPYTSMSIGLEEGLNLIGWLNCTKQISGNLTSIAGKYNYNARWNEGYEVYEPQAPEIFNDFETMERGEGYWIAAKEDCMLTVSCSG